MSLMMGKAGVWCRVVDGVLFIYFVIVAIGFPLLHSPTFLPAHVAPTVSVEFRRWFAQTFDDYFLSEAAPHFFVGAASLQLFFHWPLALASLYAIAARNSCFTTISLVYGVSFLSIAVAIISEETLSKRASSKLLTVSCSKMGLVLLLPFFRGVLAALGKGQGSVPALVDEMGKGAGLLRRVFDGVLLVYFAVLAIGLPLLQSSTCLPAHLAPPFSVEFKRWFALTFDQYLLSEDHHHFFVGVACVELFFQWPLALASVYAIAARKSCFTTISLIYAVSFLSTAALVMSEVILSKRASSKMLTLCYSCLGLALLPLFRGVFGSLGKGQGSGPAVPLAKKRA